MQEKKKRTLSLVFALLAAVIFGMSFMFSKLALEVAKPTVLLAFRFITAFAAMSLVIGVNALVGKLRGRPLFAFSLKGKPIGYLILLGLIQPVLYFFQAADRKESTLPRLPQSERRNAGASSCEEKR